MTELKHKIKSLSIIIEGNESWAQERNLPIIDGYKKGYENIFQSAEWFFEAGIETLHVLVFSSKEWDRPREETNNLIKLLRQVLENNLEEIQKNQWRILFSGQIDELPGDIPELCRNLENSFKHGQRGILNLYLNYDGKEEILNVIRKILKNKINIEQIHEGMIRKYLYNGGLDDPELIICTGGKKKLFDFQLWQSAESDLIFLDKDWPDFEEEDVAKILGIK